MKIIVFLSLIAYASAFYSYFDTVEDVEKKMQDKEHVRGAMACYLDHGKCTEKQLEAKSHLLGSVMSMCADCETKEKHKMEVALKIMIRDFPEELLEFKKKYDFDGKHFELLEADLAKY